MQMHLATGQADAVIHQVAAFNRAQGRIGIEDIGRPLLDRRVRKQPRELIHGSCDYAHDGISLTQLRREMDASRAGGTNNRDLGHDGILVAEQAKSFATSPGSLSLNNARPASTSPTP